jgi:hypothetical protein
MTEGALALEGVPVRGVEVVEGFVESCFVGDFVGDCEILEIETTSL